MYMSLPLYTQRIKTSYQRTMHILVHLNKILVCTIDTQSAHTYPPYNPRAQSTVCTILCLSRIHSDIKYNPNWYKFDNLGKF